VTNKQPLAAENWVERLLGEVCTDLGFCLPGAEQTRLLHSPPKSIDAFADEIFVAEGLNPRLADKRLWTQVREVVAKHFRIGVPAPVAEDIGSLLAQLLSIGFSVLESEYSASDFGNYHVDLQRGSVSLRLMRDRGQYLIDGPVSRLKALGLFQAFNLQEEFAEAVFTYIRNCE
jgi:hypothetical protein